MDPIGVDWQVVRGTDLMADPRLKMYRAYSGMMRDADMIEWASYSALGRAIRWFTGADVNHTSAVVHLTYQGLEDRRFMVEALEGGPELRLVSERLLKFSGRVYWYKLREDIVPEGRAKAAAWLMHELALGKHYDYPNLLANALGAVSLNGRQWFCSELYHAMLIAAGYAAKPKNGKAIRPGGFKPLGVHHPRVLIYDSREVARYA